MEVSFLKELDFKGKEPVFDSNSFLSLVTLRSIERAAADDDEEANKCEHFTIRGYVAKVRRRNAKICWPLLSHHNQTSGELDSLLPPLPVTKFRWWNCQKCLSEINTAEDVIADGAVINVQNDEVNTCKTSFLINTDARNLLSGSQQPSEKKILDGRLVQADSSVNASNGECSPSLYCDKKANASTSHGLTKEGLQIPKGGPGVSEEIQNQSSKSTIFAAEPAVAPKEYDMPPGLDINIPKADALAAISAHMSDHDSKHLNMRHTKASDNSMGLPNDTNENQDHSSQLGNSSGRFHHKKSRKVRLLDDIIRSEELCMSKKVHISCGDTYASQIKNDNDTRPDTSNWMLKHPDNISHIAIQNIQETPTMEASQNEDEENSLMDWLKKASRKAIGHKGHSENKHIDAAVGISSGSSSGQGPSRYKLQSALENENKMPPRKRGCPCLVPQQDIFIAEDASTKFLHAKIDNNKSTGCIASVKSLHHGPEIQEGTNTKAILTNKKNKAPLVEDRLKVKKKAIKKQKTTNICEQEGLDDIPMDIVELLAKHQHERRLISAGVAAENIFNLSEMTGNVRDGNDSERRGDKSKVSNAAPKNLSQQSSHFNQAIDAIHTTIRNNKDDCRVKACDSFNFRQPNLHIDLNQQPIEFLELSQCSGDPLSRLEHPVAVSNRTNFSLDKMKMQTSGSCHRDQATATKISSRNDTDVTSVPLNDTTFGSITRMNYADFNYVNVVSHDSCLDQSLKMVDQNIDCHDSHDSKFTGFQLLLGKEEARSSINICPAFAEAGNGCPSGTIKPLDLCANETISALHLLRLMDQTARLSALETNQPRSILESDLNCTNQFKELQGLEFGFGTKEMPNHPRGAGYSDQDQHQGNSSKPCHPVPIIGVLGSLLYKEIEIFSGLDSLAHSPFSLTRYDIDRDGTSNKDRTVQNLTSCCEFGNCVVNRNPADFTTPDEDEYTVGSNDPRTRYISFSKKLAVSNSSRWTQAAASDEAHCFKGLMRS